MSNIRTYETKIMYNPELTFEDFKHSILVNVRSKLPYHYINDIFEFA